jgi:hypothetical protein
MKRTFASARVGALVVLMGFALWGCSSYALEHDRTVTSPFGAAAPAAAAQAETDATRSESGKPAAPEAPKPDPDRTDRVIIYTAELSLVVNDITGVQRAIESDLKPLGAYMQRMDGHVIVMKIPVARFGEALAIVEKLGEVTNKAVTGEDVTEQMRDLNIRLKNALDVRDRLAKLLEQAVKMEDALRIEKEMERVVESIELFKGKIRFLETNAAFSTRTVQLNSPLPQRSMEMEIPFPWVRELGAEVGTGRTGAPDVPWLGSGVRFDLPEGYIKYLERDYVTRAMSGNGVLILASRHENYYGGTREFWTPYVRRALVAGRVFAMKDEPQEIQLRNGRSAVCLVGSKSIGPKRYGYLLALIALKDYVYTFESWGEEEAFQAQKAKLMETVESLRP